MFGDIQVAETDKFSHFKTEADSLVSGFQTQLQAAADNSASPAAGGQMTEGQAFMTQERQARDTLAQFLTTTGEGVKGYGTLVLAIGQEHENLISLNNATMNRLLQSADGPVPTDSRFNWEGVLARRPVGI